jgi:C4-dicarboxylate transporter DctM subunit
MEPLAAFGALVLALLLGVPVAFAFLFGAMFLVFVGDYSPSFLLPYAVGQISSIILLTIPLFIMAGGLMQHGGIAIRLIDIAESLVGRLTGGLGVVAVVASGLFSSISGSTSATVSAIGTVLLPKLDDLGYPRGHSAALIANAGVLGILIPPSGLMIVYAWLGQVSVAAAFLATAVPGIIDMALLSIVNVFSLRKVEGLFVAPPQTPRQFVSVFAGRIWSGLPAMMMPVIILGGIYGGVMTPTEAAAVAVLYAVIIGFVVYRKLRPRLFFDTIIGTGMRTGTIMVMLLGISMLSRMFIMEDVPNLILNTLTGISESPVVILLMVNLFMIVVGMLMDDTSAVVLTTPILLPVVKALGVDPIHFAAIMGVNIGMGNVTPPTAPLLYLAGTIGDVKFSEMLGPTLRMIAFAWLPTLAVVTYVPEVSLFLPRVLLGYGVR